jgi:hypothetical protein
VSFKAKWFNRLIKSLLREGFKVKRCEGSLVKIYPPDNIGGKFYSCHASQDAYFPLKRFAKNEWGLDLDNLGV